MEIDQFATTLLEEAKRFGELAAASRDPAGTCAHQHAAIMLGFCALEAHINAIAEDFRDRTDLSAHERGLMFERKVVLDEGEFEVVETLQMARLEDRIQFLYRKFSGKPIDGAAGWWSDLRAAIRTRNDLTHPKGATALSRTQVEQALRAILDSIDALYKAIYKKPFPAASRGLQSSLTF